MSFVVGTGFTSKSRHNVIDFAELWLRQIYKQINAHDHIYVIDHTWFERAEEPGNMVPNESMFPFRSHAITTIPAHNLGHVHNLIGKWEPKMDFQLCGWSASIMLLAMLAYNARKDLFFVEQDTLLFGDCFGQAYRDAANKQMVFGRCKLMNCAQSFFLCKHAFLPVLVQDYLAMWPDTNEHKRPEHKFLALEVKYPQHVGRLSFGVDRDRPLPWSAPIWYGQHFTQTELGQLKVRGLL